MTWTAIRLHRAARATSLLAFAGFLGACSSSTQPPAAHQQASTTGQPPSLTQAPAEIATALPANGGPAEAGMRVYLDPETGELGPVPAGVEIAGDVRAAATSALSEPVETVLPDGSVMMELNGHGQEYFILDIAEDGSRSVRCVQDPAAPLQAPAAPASPEVR